MFRLNVKPSERRAVPPDYYDFLQEIPLIDEKWRTGVSHFSGELDLEAKWDRLPRLADRYKLSGLGLSPAVHAQLDSMYDAHRRLMSRPPDHRARPPDHRASRPPRLESVSPSIDTQTYLPGANKRNDYQHNRPRMIDMSELSPVTQSQLDSMYHNRQPLKPSHGIDSASLGPRRPSSTRLHPCRADLPRRLQNDTT